MFMLIGAVMLLLGFISGLFLLLMTLGIGPAEPGLATWIMFPGLTLLGYVTMLPGKRVPLIGTLSLLAGGALLLLATAALILIFLAANGLHANGLHAASGGSAALWYVLAVGLLFGSVGYALRGAGRDDPPSLP